MDSLCSHCILFFPLIDVVTGLSGCIFNINCSNVLTHLLFSLCKTVQGNFNSKVALLCIYVSLLAFMLTFLLGVHNTSRSYEGTPQIDLQTNNIPESDRHKEPDNVACTAAAALLHFFLLATFTWNAVYGTQLVLLIRSMRSSLPPYWTWLSQAVGWGGCPVRGSNSIMKYFNSQK